MVRQVTQAGATALILIAVLYAGTVAAHGKVSMEEDICVRRAGDSMVHLSAYQPQHEPTGQYCLEIPMEGDTFLVVDLVDQALREIPVGMRIVRGIGETEGEIVSLVNASIHIDGVLHVETSLEQGLYTVIITAEGTPPMRYHYLLRVRMINYANIFRQAIVPLIALLLLTLVGYKLMKSKRVQKWRASRNS